MEEKSKVMTTSALPATLELCTQMKETNCFFWVKDPVCVSNSGSHMFLFSLIKPKWIENEMGTFNLGSHDGAPSILSFSPGL